MLIDGRVRAVASATSAAAVHATGEHHHIISKESLHLITSHACTTAKNVEEEYGAGSSRQQHVLVLVLRFTGSVRDERRGHGRFQRFRPCSVSPPRHACTSAHADLTTSSQSLSRSRAHGPGRTASTVPRSRAGHGKRRRLSRAPLQSGQRAARGVPGRPAGPSSPAWIDPRDELG